MNPLVHGRVRQSAGQVVVAESSVGIRVQAGTSAAEIETETPIGGHCAVFKDGVVLTDPAVAMGEGPKLNGAHRVTGRQIPAKVGFDARLGWVGTACNVGIQRN